MTQETFKPISVKSPTKNRIVFKMRCLVDLQLKTIFDFLKNELKMLPSGNIIDVGAGDAPWKDLLPPSCSYKGIDIYDSKAFGMNQQNNDITYYDGRNIPLDANSFDGAICIEVLEHAIDPDFLIKEIARILKPNAPLLLTAPWSARRHHIPFDYHRFTREGLFEILSKNGFKNILIKERGNDYCVVFNKNLIMLIRNLKKLSLKNFFYKLPLIAFVFFCCVITFFISHISLVFAQNEDKSEDPLGYFCKSYKA